VSEGVQKKEEGDTSIKATFEGFRRWNVPL